MDNLAEVLCLVVYGFLGSTFFVLKKGKQVVGSMSVSELVIKNE